MVVPTKTTACLSKTPVIDQRHPVLGSDHNRVRLKKNRGTEIALKQMETRGCTCQGTPLTNELV